MTELPLDRTIQAIQLHKNVYSARLHPLLCALTSAELVAYAEQPSKQMPDIVSGKFRSMLIDIFGRSYPEKKFFIVDRDAVSALQGARPPECRQGWRDDRRPPAQRGGGGGLTGGAYRPLISCLFSRRPGLYSRRHQHLHCSRVMAGHSQFKNIMHRKGRQDKARSKLFGKLAREITVAAKLGLPDPAFNPRLRAAIMAARAENMPKDNIDRAIKKSQGSESENYDEIRYEGYGPGGVAVIVEALTDNHNRTAGEVRAIFTKNGGNLATTGAVSFMFDHVGVVEYDAKAANADAMLEAAIEAGAEDVMSNDDGHQIFTTPGDIDRGRQGAGREIRRAAQGRARCGSRRTRSRSTTKPARSC